MNAPAIHSLLPHAAPASPEHRLVLYGIRRMAAGGIGDAHAASAFLMRFGMHYRRPLVLVRALVSEISRAATARLTIAPCCCPRMSRSEHAIVQALALAGDRPDEAHTTLAALLQVRSCGAVLSSIQAVAACLADLAPQAKQ